MQFNNPTLQQKMKTKNTTAPQLIKSMGRSPSRLTLLLIPLVFVCFGFSPRAQGALQPPPSGGYPNDNTAVGQNVLFNLTTGRSNTAVGSEALFSNTTGIFNTAIGVATLLHNTTGPGNTAIGGGALVHNTSGSLNTAVGHDALGNNTIGKLNTAIGEAALFSNKIGSNNTAIGNRALSPNTGSNNVALGDHAGNNLTTGDNNIVIGTNVVGNPGDSNTIRIGKGITETFIDGIKGATASGGAAVFVVGEGGKLGTMPSSARFKDEIKPIDKASEAILALKPVSFRYKKEVDPQRVAQFGLVAEDVEKINPDLVIRDVQGRPQTVRYEQVNAMLLNEFLKEHRTVQELKSTVATQEATILQQKKDFQAIASQQQQQIEVLTAGLQKVSALVETSKPAPQVVLNNQ
jgi:hypothetical protein